MQKQQENVVFCSICTLNYAAYAQTLTDSLGEVGYAKTKHFVLIIDYRKEYASLLKQFNFTPILLEDLEIPNIKELLEKYDPFEISNVLKPFFLEWVLRKQKKVDYAVYLDTDIFVYSKIDDVLEYFKENPSASVVLTPHILDIEGFIKSDKYTWETTFLTYGIYNGGFYVLKNDTNALKFLSWHKRKLAKYGFFAPYNQMFVDQKILDLAPVLFPFVHIYKNNAYNISYWNYDRNNLSLKKETYFVGSKKLAFFHFSKICINSENIKESSLNDIPLKGNEILSKLVLDYYERLLKNKHREIKQIPYLYKDIYKKSDYIKDINLLLSLTKKERGMIWFLRRLKHKIRPK